MDVFKCVICKTKLSDPWPDLCADCEEIEFFDETPLGGFIEGVGNFCKEIPTMIQKFFWFTLVMLTGMLGCIALWGGLQFIK